ncbi:hypothetical protein BJD66_gp64 [Gordonia phage Emalyn]|uniref:Uncharacterized protein n=1 Tax=Gordonia phage Emalyn TaxID=1821552 RepID=A0A142KC00_9CAUD|nr:hypothetical protein BJD66_gp64 [Gordonia phage Emalyn]AMS03633.1 hypothetical protein SEA_EMALYN_64 [Gordonia phage Emalyn]
MSRRGKPRRLKGSQASGHSSLANGWFIPSGMTVEAVEKKARELWGKIEDDPPTPEEYKHRPALVNARAVGRVEGMAIALAILKQGPDGQVLKASDELRRIKHGKPGSPADRAGN